MEDTFMDISIEVPKEVIIKVKLDRLTDGLNRLLFMAQNEDLMAHRLAVAVRLDNNQQ